jgi:hypothetical protein
VVKHVFLGNTKQIPNNFKFKNKEKGVEEGTCSLLRKKKSPLLGERG